MIKNNHELDLDFLFIKALGHNPVWQNDLNGFYFNVNNVTIVIRKNELPKISSEWIIQVGDKEQTKITLNNIKKYIEENEEVLEKINKGLSISEQEKKMFIVDNFDYIFQPRKENEDETI